MPDWQRGLCQYPEPRAQNPQLRWWVSLLDGDEDTNCPVLCCRNGLCEHNRSYRDSTVVIQLHDWQRCGGPHSRGDVEV